MVARGPGAVGCAHCTKLGAVVACGVCKHLVCEPCANDWSTCDQPWGRVFRLGMTGRLVDVDPTGKYGLVTRWRGRMRYVDLRALRWIEVDDVPSLHRRELRPRLASDGRLFQHEWQNVEDQPAYRGLGVTSLTSRQTRTDPSTPYPARGTGMSLRDDRYWYVTSTEEVAVVRMASPIALTTALYNPLPRKVLQAVYVDAARDLIVSASWGEIMVQKIAGERLEPACYVKTAGDVRWVAIAGPYLAAHVKGGITVWKLDESLAIAQVSQRIDDDVGIAALSRDGRYLAVGLRDERVVVHALDAGTSESYDEHTDDVSYVGFVGDEQLLVTADDDNRVILRPRAAAGYARPLRETELGSD